MVVLGITAAGYLVTQGPSTVVMTSRSRRIIVFGCVRFDGAPPNTVLISAPDVRRCREAQQRTSKSEAGK
jgi:hypothetical protein